MRDQNKAENQASHQTYQNTETIIFDDEGAHEESVNDIKNDP